MKKNKIAIFDFDGTISYKDSIKEFFKFRYGLFYFFYGYYLRFMPIIFLCLIKSYSFEDLKKKRIQFFLKNVNTASLKKDIDLFYRKFFANNLKEEALEKLKWHKNNGHKIVILSASLDIILRKWCLKNGYLLITNNLVVLDNKFTGEFEGKDCNGEEKVKRLKNTININDFDFIYGYGDTDSDLAFLKLVDKSYFQYFK